MHSPLIVILQILIGFRPGIWLGHKLWSYNLKLFICWPIYMGCCCTRSPLDLCQNRLVFVAIHDCHRFSWASHSTPYKSSFRPLSILDLGLPVLGNVTVVSYFSTCWWWPSMSSMVHIMPLNYFVLLSFNPFNNKILCMLFKLFVYHDFSSKMKPRWWSQKSYRNSCSLVGVN